MSFFIGLIIFDITWVALTFSVAKINNHFLTVQNQASLSPHKISDEDMAASTADVPKTMVFIAINALVILNIAAITIYLVNR